VRRPAYAKTGQDLPPSSEGAIRNYRPGSAGLVPQLGRCGFEKAGGDIDERSFTKSHSLSRIAFDGAPLCRMFTVHLV
jgi:hypothetical protein